MPPLGLTQSGTNVFTFGYPSLGQPPCQPSPAFPPQSGSMFLSSRGPSMTMEDMQREMRRMKEAEEERKRGTQLTNPGHLHVNQELVYIQTSWARVQCALENWHGSDAAPVSIQEAVDAGK